MIRKWSYININPTGLLKSVMFFKNKYKFKIFRKTTKFRRFQIGKTRGLRKLPILLNRRTDKLNISYITYKWLYFYLKSKQIIRFQQNLFTAPYTIYSLSKNFFIKNFSSLNLISNQGYNFLTCPRRTSLLFPKNKNTYFIDTGKQIYANKFIQTNSLNLVKNTPLINSNLLFYEKLHYPIDIFSKFQKNKIIQKVTINKLFMYILRIAISILISVRRLLILVVFPKLNKCY